MLKVRVNDTGRTDRPLDKPGGGVRLDGCDQFERENDVEAQKRESTAVDLTCDSLLLEKKRIVEGDQII